MLNKLYFFVRVFKISPAIAFRKILDNLLSTLDKNRQRLIDLETSTFLFYQKDDNISKFSFFSKITKILRDINQPKNFRNLFDNSKANFNIISSRFNSYDFIYEYENQIPLQSENILNEADRVVQHQFNVLGSGLTIVEPGCDVKGIDNIIIKNDTVKFINSYDGQNITNIWYNWLKKNVNPLNFDRSLSISSKISIEYTPIDWQLDFKSGYRWNATEWSFDIQYGNIKGADIKVPWELGRMQHLVWLALAFALNQKKKNDGDIDNENNIFDDNIYVKEFKNEVLDFIASNPPRYGVQWMCSMDIGIRAVNWLIAYDIFKGSGVDFDEEFEQIFLDSIIHHANHLTNNLEWSSGMRGNHYFTNIASLLIISSYLNTNEITNSWLAFAIQELINETEIQFLSDGGNFEKSVAYHLYVVEVLLMSLSFLSSLNKDKLNSLNTIRYVDLFSNKKLFQYEKQKFKIENNKIILPKTFWERFASILQFTISIVNQTGKTIQIGDNDSGQLIKFLPKNNYSKDVFYNELSDYSLKVLSLISGFLNTEYCYYFPENVVSKMSFYKNIISFIKSDVLDLQTINEFSEDISNNLFDNKNEDMTAISFPEFGLYINKSPIYDTYIKCGSLGQNGKGGHSHNDNLSICMIVKNSEVFVDPGTYNYTALPEKRNLYRSTQMHNTLEIAGYEQNDWLNNSKDDLFWFHKIKSRGRVLEFSERIFVGEHFGYPKTHKRIVTFEKSFITGVDLCEFKGIKRINFHLAPGVLIESLDSNRVILDCRNNSIILTYQNAEAKVETYFYSNGYGNIIPAKKIILSSEENKINWKIEIKE
jgi:hypothetical protein